jgi:hypothetical protein
MSNLTARQWDTLERIRRGEKWKGEKGWLHRSANALVARGLLRHNGPDSYELTVAGEIVALTRRCLLVLAQIKELENRPWEGYSKADAQTGAPEHPRGG